MRSFITNSSVVIVLIMLGVVPVAAWLNTPLEVFDRSTGQCLYQLEPTDFGFGDGRRVPCGTYGELAVERISETFMQERN